MDDHQWELQCGSVPEGGFRRARGTTKGDRSLSSGTFLAARGTYPTVESVHVGEQRGVSPRLVSVNRSVATGVQGFVGSSHERGSRWQDTNGSVASPFSGGNATEIDLATDHVAFTDTSLGKRHGRVGSDGTLSREQVEGSPRASSLSGIVLHVVE